MTGESSPRPPKVPRPEPAPRVPTPAPEQAVAAARWPVVREQPDGTAVVTFVRDDPSARAVLLFVNRLADERRIGDSEMEPVGDGRHWVLSYRMSADWRASYAFVRHEGPGDPPWRALDGQVRLRDLLDRGEVDQRNPARSRNGAGRDVSVVELPAAPPQPWRSSLPGPRPAEVRLPTGHGSTSRDIFVHSTPGAVSGSPLVVVTDAEAWCDHHGLPASLDRAVAAGAFPAVHAVFVSSGDRAHRWRDLGDPGGVAEFIGTRVVPWARARLGAGDDPRRTVVTGQSLGGLAALWAVARHPATIGAAVVQSASLWHADPVGELVARDDVTLYVEVGLQEWLLLPLHRQLADRLAPSRVDLRYVEFNGGHDYACWRGGLMDGLVSILSSAPES